MADFETFIAERLSRGRLHFTRDGLLRALSASSSTLTHSLSRLARRGRIANPRPGFYLILRAQDKDAGAPDPALWIHPLMQHQGMDYRISLLTAARLHGATPEPQSFQLIVPRALRDFSIGKYRLEFVAQAAQGFDATNRPEWLEEMKTESGFAKAAGIELTLLDCARYFHKAGGISVVGTVAAELGAKILPRKLAALARSTENAAVQRLGYLLELAGHEEAAKALEPIAQEARSVKRLDPSLEESPGEMSGRWKIVVNRPVKPGS